MIQSAMMFALGVFVSGLLWLAIAAALVRRAKRLTETRLLATVATRRVEFETERDEMRARHAVQMHRLEREVSRVLDRATSHRLEADIREHDVVSLRTELQARDEELEDLRQKLLGQRDELQELERRHAEDGSALRAVQHSLKLEITRRTAASEALDEALLLADKRRLELAALRAENEALSHSLPAAERDRILAEIQALPETPYLQAAVPTPSGQVQRDQSGVSGGSVVALPMRGRAAANDSPDQSAAIVAEAARDLQRLAGEVPGVLGSGVWRAPAQSEPRMPVANVLDEPGVVAALGGHRHGGAPAEAGGAADNPESRFSEALAEIRALKRASSQAGE